MHATWHANVELSNHLNWFGPYRCRKESVLSPKLRPLPYKRDRKWQCRTRVPTPWLPVCDTARPAGASAAPVRRRRPARQDPDAVSAAGDRRT
jgi:hypothetical protein